MTWVALSGSSTSSTYPLVTHSLPPSLPRCLDKSEYTQRAPLLADPTSRSLRRLGEQAVNSYFFSFSRLRIGRCESGCIPHERYTRSLWLAGWGGDLGGCGVGGLVGFNVCGTAERCGDE
jgi:hypothetical protein